MSIHADGGPAFPRAASTDEHSQPCNVYLDQMGMSLRDYFAASALQGLLANRTSLLNMHTVECSYRYADLMLAERAKKVT